MTKNADNIKWRVTELEKSYNMLDGKVDKILENHLPHIQVELEKINSKIRNSTIFNVGAIILAAVLLKFLK